MPAQCRGRPLLVNSASSALSPATARVIGTHVDAVPVSSGMHEDGESDVRGSYCALSVAT
eukprot:6207205-Pleurochrysis_carterae.AAC.5